MAIGLSRENNFDFLRFVAACLVLFSHSFPLYGVKGEPFAVATAFDTFGGLAVGTFFVISGFLITASWTKNPKLYSYLRNRVIRIFPGYSAVIMLAIVLGACITTLPLSEYIRHPVTLDYLGNFLLYMQRFDLPGVFTDNPQPGVNGSIWTLPKEFTMYLLLAALGYTRLLRGPVLLVSYLGCFAGYIIYMETHRDFADAWFYSSLTKNAVYFFAGALFWHYRERITLSPELCLLMLIVLALSAQTPWSKYSFMLCLPYLVIFAGLWDMRSIRNFGKYGDFSYGLYLYAFPVQQCYMLWVGERWGFWTFPLVCLPITFCFAVASWYLVEKPWLRRKTRALRKPSELSS